MKKFLFFLITFIVGTGVIVYIIVSMLPKSIQLNAQGFKYRLGDESKGNTVTVKIEGKMYKSMTGNKTFKGTIDIKDEQIPVPEEKRQLEISFRKELFGLIIYSYIENGKPYLFSLGHIYFDKSFSKATFTIYDRVSGNSNRGTWNANNGIMIAVPASDRIEAVSISNKLMKKYLDGFILK